MYAAARPDGEGRAHGLTSRPLIPTVRDPTNFAGSAVTVSLIIRIASEVSARRGCHGCSQALQRALRQARGPVEEFDAEAQAWAGRRVLPA